MKPEKNTPVVVGISGGVDSSIAAWQLKEWGHEFYTEAIFDDTGLRADVIDADAGIIYEVVNTENNDSILRKGRHYPLEIRVVNANQKFSEDLLLSLMSNRH